MAVWVESKFVNKLKDLYWDIFSGDKMFRLVSLLIPHIFGHNQVNWTFLLLTNYEVAF